MPSSARHPPKSSRADNLLFLQKRLRLALKNAPVSLKEVSACLDHLDTLPCIQRQRFFRHALSDVALKNVQDAAVCSDVHASIGTRLLHSMNVLWTPSPDSRSNPSRLLSQQTLHQEKEPSDFRTYPLHAVLRDALDVLLSWGNHEDVWREMQEGMLPALNIPPSPPWNAQQTSFMLNFFYPFLRCGATGPLERTYAGCFDLKHSMWKESAHLNHLLSDLTHQNMQHRATCLRLIEPACLTQDAYKGQGGLFLLELATRLCSQATIIGSPTKKAFYMQALHAAFPWLLDAASTPTLKAILRMRCATSSSLTLESAQYEHESSFTSLRVPLSKNIQEEPFTALTLGEKCIHFIPLTCWLTWGDTQDTASQEALLWMLTCRGRLEECTRLLEWAKRHHVPETWWCSTEATPGLLACMAHTLYRSAPFSSHTYVQILERWVEELEQASPAHTARLKQDLGVALDTHLAVSDAFGAFETPPRSTCLSSEDAARLLRMGLKVDKAWWSAPYALTLHDVQQQEVWTRKLWSCVEDSNDAWTFTGKEIPFAIPGLPAPSRLERLVPHSDLFHAYRESCSLEAALTDSTEKGPPVSSAKSRARL